MRELKAEPTRKWAKTAFMLNFQLEELRKWAYTPENGKTRLKAKNRIKVINAGRLRGT